MFFSFTKYLLPVATRVSMIRLGWLGIRLTLDDDPLCTADTVAAVQCIDCVHYMNIQVHDRNWV